jgi:hypothetical protein
MKLTHLLRALEEEEYQEFEKLLQSPFIKASEKYLKFFRFLRKHYPALQLTREALTAAYRKCFGEATYSGSGFYNLTSEMSRQLELFFVLQLILDKDGAVGTRAGKVLLVQALGQRNSGAYFRTEAQRVIEKMEDAPMKKAEDFLALHQIHQMIYFHSNTPKHLDHPPHLTLAAENLERYYYIARLRYFVEMKERERLLATKKETTASDAFQSLIPSAEWLENQPITSVYYRLIHLLEQDANLSDFKAIQVLFREKLPDLPKEDQRYIWQHLVNYGVFLTRHGQEVEWEMLDLYRLAIDKDILLVSNRITDQAFVNIVTVAALCKEYAWAKTFISDYAARVDPNHRKAVGAYASAVLCFECGQWDEAQGFLIPEVFLTPGLELTSRGLLLKIIFERYVKDGRDYEFLHSHAESFERYLETKQISEDRKIAQLNNIRFIRKMARLKFETVQVPNSKKETLKRQLENIAPISSKKWLEQKIEAI